MKNNESSIAGTVEALLDTLDITNNQTYYFALIGEDGHNWTGCNGDARVIAKNLLHTCIHNPELIDIVLNVAKVILAKDRSLFKDFALKIIAEQLANDIIEKIEEDKDDE